MRIHLIHHVLSHNVKDSIWDFFFSSRRRHTRYWRDWSSDVCSSDLLDIDGWTLLLGVGIDTCSSLHLAEDVPLPEPIRAYFRIPDAIQRDYDPSEWSIGYGGTPEDAWGKVYAEAERRGLIWHHEIGNAACQLFKAHAMVQLYREWRRTDPFGLFGVPNDPEAR